MGTLSGKVALVTGAGQGVGRGIALALAAEGANIAIVDINAETAAQSVRLIEQRGVRAISVVADVRDPRQIQRSVDEVIETLGGIQILVNNAQTFPLGPLLQVSEDDMLSGFESGTFAVLRYMRACHPHLKGGGVIINLSSPAAVSLLPPNMVGVYAAIKSATQALTRAAAVEWARDGIRALAILPVSMSPANERALENPTYRDQVLNAIPLGRIGDPEQDIGRITAFLCGPSASYLTGVMLPIDGGASYLR